MVRSFTKKQQHEDLHYDLQKKQFNTFRNKLLRKVDKHLINIERGNLSKEDGKRKIKATMKEVNKLEFQFSRATLSLGYGRCIVNGTGDSEIKEVSFIPGTCQLHTQHCFEKR